MDAVDATQRSTQILLTRTDVPAIAIIFFTHLQYPIKFFLTLFRCILFLI